MSMNYGKMKCGIPNITMCYNFSYGVGSAGAIICTTNDKEMGGLLPVKLHVESTCSV